MKQETVVENLAATKPRNLRVQVRAVVFSIDDRRLTNLSSIGEQDVACLQMSFFELRMFLGG